MSKTIQSYDCSVDLMRVLLWQDNEAKNLQALIKAQQDWIDENHCRFWDDWYKDVFNLDTANDFGLRVWSEILGLRLFATNIGSPDDFPAFGFDSDSAQNFDNGNFAVDSDQPYALATEQIRIVLKLRYFQITSRGTVPEINRALRTVFGKRSAFVVDNRNMTMTYVFAKHVSVELRRAILELDVLPRPSGVGVSITSRANPSWGFSPASRNFNNGNFIGGM
ncbi:DUF2612 domain-containing protein [Vibrio harveyi]|uniref:DUF2612 domain-containing protein n=1 Tax=Vibrio harveyi TaxID=669 RepID=UPI000D784E78|nr:DUF2612 domain-containing protein [Vibrio harveyi]GBK97755.1 phage protein [Vibrio harveyi]HDM8061711.1 DUF2612 domain-containing protein [Vibrio harveyi]